MPNTQVDHEGKKVYNKFPIKETIKDILTDAGDIHAGREKEYGEAWRLQGAIMKELFPLGIALRKEEDFQTYHLINTLVMKLKRLAHSLKQGKGVHEDSATDSINYNAMLVLLAREKK